MARYQLNQSLNWIQNYSRESTYQNYYKHVNAKWADIVVFFIRKQINGPPNEEGNSQVAQTTAKQEENSHAYIATLSVGISSHELERIAPLSWTSLGFTCRCWFGCDFGESSVLTYVSVDEF